MKNTENKTKILKKLGSVVGTSVMLVAPIAIATTNLNNDQTTSLTTTQEPKTNGQTGEGVEVGDVFFLPNNSGSKVGMLRYTIKTLPDWDNNIPGTVTIGVGLTQPTGEFIIPDSVEYNGSDYNVVEIEEGGFKGCTKITSISFPNGITKISADAFRDCSSLTAVNIPDTVTVIGSYAFYSCSNLKTVVMGGRFKYNWWESFWKLY